MPNKVEAKPIADIVARSPCGAKVSGALRRLTMYSPRTAKTVRGQVDSVDIKRELVCSCSAELPMQAKEHAPASVSL